MQHIKSLDGVRGIAVLLVIIAHTPFIANAETLNFTLKILKEAEVGYIGVEIFFILSGFLITSILMKSINSNLLKDFYTKRAFRLLPVIVISITGCYLFFPEYEYFYQIFFLSNYYFSFESAAHPLRHFWSLAVEEQFYIFWPLILLACKKDPSKLKFVIISIALMSVASILIYDFIIATDVSRALINRGIETRMISLLAGSSMAIYGLPKVSIKTIITVAAISLGLIVIAKLGSRYYNGPYISTVRSFGYLTFSSCFFIFAIKDKSFVRAIFESTILTYLGKISYGLYVYHLPVFFYFGISHMQEGRLNVTLKDIVFIYAIIFAITLFSWYVIESPLLKVKDRVLKNRLNHVMT